MDKEKIKDLIERYTDEKCTIKTGPLIDAGEFNEVLDALGIDPFAKNISGPGEQDGTLIFPMLLLMILSLANEIENIKN